MLSSTSFSTALSKPLASLCRPELFVELVPEGKQSVHGAALAKANDEEIKKQAKPEPEKKSKAAVLEGNLALKFLMNSKELSQIVGFKDKKKRTETKAEPAASIDLGSANSSPPVNLQKSRKYKYPIKSINE